MLKFPAALFCITLPFTAALGALLASTATAATPSAATVASGAKESEKIGREIRKDLAERRSLSFGPLVRIWETKYGAKAVPSLLNLASDAKRADTDRYLALMGAAKLGGERISRQIARYLSDTSWMIRSGALQALSGLNAREESHRVIALLKDPALVVRVEAVRTVVKLQPTGSVDALLSSLEDPRNYHGGKAQWVPQAALRGLIELKAKGSAPRLLPLLSRKDDPQFLEITVEALEKLTGQKLKAESPLPTRVEEWKKTLASAS